MPSLDEHVFFQLKATGPDPGNNSGLPRQEPAPSRWVGVGEGEGGGVYTAVNLQTQRPSSKLDYALVRASEHDVVVIFCCDGQYSRSVSLVRRRKKYQVPGPYYPLNASQEKQKGRRSTSTSTSKTDHLNKKKDTQKPSGDNPLDETQGKKQAKTLVDGHNQHAEHNRKT